MDTTQTCDVVYSGPTMPGHHGVKCIRPAGHDEDPRCGWLTKHTDGNIRWYTPEQKALIDKTGDR